MSGRAGRSVGGHVLDGLRPEEQTERGLDRVVNFSDAVVAIAITLIVLPLVDLAGEREMTGTVFLRDGSRRLAAAALSFAIVGALWREHHSELERAGRYTRLLIRLDLLWLAAIVFLPVPTALLFSDFQKEHQDIAADALYVGTLLVAFAVMRLIQLEIALHCLPEGRPPLRRRQLVAAWVPVALMATALGLCLAGLGTKALLVVLLAFPIEWFLRWRWRRSTASGGEARSTPAQPH